MNEVFAGQLSACTQFERGALSKRLLLLVHRAVQTAEDALAG